MSSDMIICILSPTASILDSEDVDEVESNDPVERRVLGSNDCGDLNALCISSNSVMKLWWLLFTFGPLASVVTINDDPWWLVFVVDRTRTNSFEDDIDDDDEYEDGDANATTAPLVVELLLVWWAPNGGEMLSLLYILFKRSLYTRWDIKWLLCYFKSFYVCIMHQLKALWYLHQSFI